MSDIHLSANRRSTVKPVRRSRSSVALTLFLALLQPTLFANIGLIIEQPLKAAYRKHPYRPPGAPVSLPSTQERPRKIGNPYLQILAQACVCRQHARIRRNLGLNSSMWTLYHRNRRRNTTCASTQFRSVHHAARTSLRPAALRAIPSREDYLNLVDTYRELYTQAITWEPELPPYLTPNLTIEQPQLPGPSLHGHYDTPDITSLPYFQSHTRSLVKATVQKVPDIKIKEEQSREDAEKTNRKSPLLPTVINLSRVLNMSGCTHDEAFQAYSAIPSPGVSYLPAAQIRLLFRRLAAVEKRCRETAMNYLSVVDEMKLAHLGMTEAEWNSAIAFCGQCSSYVRAEDLEKALVMWKEMESEAHVKSSNVTFNILFDMAAKAGKYTLAEMILQEMESRGFRRNRYSRVGTIYFHGLKGDGQGIRKAYHELVQAGEVVDTVVMNCVIASLMKAGEFTSAELVYGRMKQMLAKHGGHNILKRTWQETRDLGRILDRLARRRETSEIDGKLALLTKRVSIVPDVHTYSMFVEYHANQTGDLYRISAFLHEMQSLGISIHGRIFLKIFKGFTKHGGKAYTSWTSPILKRVWESLLAGVDSGCDDVKITKWVVIWAVRAFDQCAGRQWSLYIWEELRIRWKPSPKELDSVHGRLHHILAAQESGPKRSGSR